MSNFYKILSLIVVLIVGGVVILTNKSPDAISGQESELEYFSPSDIVIDSNGRAFIAGYTAKKIVVFDTNTQKEINEIKLPVSPGGLALSKDEKKLYVTCSIAEGSLKTFDTVDYSCLSEILLGHTPLKPVLDPVRENLLYVCNRFGNDVSVVDIDKQLEVYRFPAEREPVNCVVSNDGKYLFIANLLPDFSSTPDYASANVTTINLQTSSLMETIPLPKGSNALRGMCLSEDGKYLYVVHVLARYKLPTTKIIDGWINNNALSIIDAKTLRPVNTVLLDDPGCGAANPWSVVCMKNNEGINHLCISLSGTDELMMIDEMQLRNRLDECKGRFTNIQIMNDLSFLAGIKSRLYVNSKGVRELSVNNDKLYLLNYFSDNVNVFSGGTGFDRIELNSRKDIDEIRRGEILFNDATVCFQKWQSCSSCHPDARVDTFEWDLLNDGIGNPKNTKSLINSHETPPVMSLGIRSDAEVAVRAGIRYILFSYLDNNDAVCIDNYLKSLQPISRFCNDTDNLEKIKEGRSIFEALGCAKCHSGPLLTDKRKHDIGTGLEKEKQMCFDTPSLRELWRTSPYFHSGNAKTIWDSIVMHKSELLDKKVSELTEHEKECLILYLMSL